MSDLIILQNKDEVTVGLLSNEAENACPYWGDLYREDEETGAETYEFYVPADHPEAQKILKNGFILRAGFDGKIRQFQIAQIEEDDSGDELSIFVFCEFSWIELIGDIIRPYSLPGTDAASALQYALSNSRYEPGIVDFTGNQDLDQQGYDTALKMVHDIKDAFELKPVFYVTYSNGEITGRYVDLLKVRGANRGKVIENGKDLIRSRRTFDRMSVATALIGIGRGSESGENLTFEGIVWDTGNGDPVNKPFGQDFVEDPAARAEWGIGGRNIVKTYEYDTTDPATLLRATWRELQRIKNGLYTYEAEAVDLTAAGFDWERGEIGDELLIINSEMTPRLQLNARIIKLERSFTEPERNKATFGDYQPAISRAEGIEEIRSTLLREQNRWRETGSGAAVVRSAEEPPGDINTIWIEPATGSRPYDIIRTWDESAQEYVLNVPLSAADIDAETQIFKQSDAPPHLPGRLWLDIGQTPNVLKRSDGSQWVNTSPQTAEEIGAEKSIYKQATAPAHSEGRLWLDTSRTPNVLFRSEGNTWVKASPTTAGEVGADEQGAAAAAQAAAIAAAEQDASEKAAAAQSAAETFAAAQAALAETEANSYADGIVTAEEQARIAQAQDVLDAAEADATAKAEAAREAAEAAAALYVSSRGENLVTNGTGLMRSDFNFSEFDFVESPVYSGAGSFFTDRQNATLISDELIPVDPESTYELSLYAKSAQGIGKNYFGFSLYDVDTNRIEAPNHMYVAGSTTELAQDLKPGDTKAFLNDVSGFSQSTSLDYQKRFIFWDYVTAGGQEYGTETYSRNLTIQDLWTDSSAFNASENSITLAAPYDGPLKAAGTPLSQGSNGGSYKYSAGINITVPTEWTNITGRISEVEYTGANSYTRFAPGTSFVKLLFLTNRSSSGGQAGDSLYISNVELYNVKQELRAVAAAQADATEKANAAQQAAETFAAAQAALAEAEANAYADGIVTQEEQERINQAQDILDAAAADAQAKATAAEEAAEAAAAIDAQTKADAAQSNAATDATNKAKIAEYEAYLAAAQSLAAELQARSRVVLNNSAYYTSAVYTAVDNGENNLYYSFQDLQTAIQNAIADGAITAAEENTISTVKGVFESAAEELGDAIQDATKDATGLRVGTITGITLQVANAGISSEGSLSSSVRIWAGTGYSGRTSAPFRVTDAGKVTASDIDIIGGSINISDNVTVGNYLYLGSTGSTAIKRVYFNNLSYISGTDIAITHSAGRHSFIAAGTEVTIDGGGFVTSDPNGFFSAQMPNARFSDGLEAGGMIRAEGDLETDGVFRSFGAGFSINNVGGIGNTLYMNGLTGGHWRANMPEEGYFGVSGYAHGIGTGVAFCGVGVNFRTQKTYTPSSISRNTLSAQIDVSSQYNDIQITTGGFFVYLTGYAGRSKYYSYRGEYTA